MQVLLDYLDGGGLYIICHMYRNKKTKYKNISLLPVDLFVQVLRYLKGRKYLSNLI